MGTKEEEHNRGQQDYSKGKDSIGGPMRHEPCAKVFETDDEYQDRLDAYNTGFDNAAKNDK